MSSVRFRFGIVGAFHFVFLIYFSVGCEEKNPYASRVAQAGSSSEAVVGGGEESESVSEGQDQQAEDLSEEALNITQEICGSGATFSSVSEAFSAACVDGQASVALAGALESPYEGAGDPVINLLQSDDINGVSQFLVITSLKVASTPEEILAQSNAMNEDDFEEGNATVTQTEVSSNPGDSSPVSLATEIQFDLNVSVGIINVADTRILTKEYLKVSEEGGILGYRSFLKSGAPDNEDNIIASQVSFWVPDETGTIFITVSQQHAENRNQHETAETTFLNIARRTLLQTYGLLN